ncbi:MAG: hypothetical protein DDT35_00114 [Firmicutes bacterium]|nr:hypothetical protein [Bacillota bacterium]
MGGVGHSIEPADIDATPADFCAFIEQLRGITGGVPIGAKIAAGMDIEQDITFLVKSGVDFIAIDGAEAATKGSSPTLQDDFGLPTVMALGADAVYIGTAALY